MAGLGCLRALSGVEDVQCTLLESTRVLGGRVRSKTALGALAFDHGASYFTCKSDDAPFAEVLRAAESAGAVQPWSDPDGSHGSVGTARTVLDVSAGHHVLDPESFEPFPESKRLYVGAPSMASLPSFVADRLARAESPRGVLGRRQRHSRRSRVPLRRLRRSNRPSRPRRHGVVGRQAALSERATLGHDVSLSRGRTHVVQTLGVRRPRPRHERARRRETPPRDFHPGVGRWRRRARRRPSPRRRRRRHPGRPVLVAHRRVRPKSPPSPPRRRAASPARFRHRVVRE